MSKQTDQEFRQRPKKYKPSYTCRCDYCVHPYNDPSPSERDNRRQWRTPKLDPRNEY